MLKLIHRNDYHFYQNPEYLAHVMMWIYMLSRLFPKLDIPKLFTKVIPQPYAFNVDMINDAWTRLSMNSNGLLIDRRSNLERKKVKTLKDWVEIFRIREREQLMYGSRRCKKSWMQSMITLFCSTDKNFQWTHIDGHCVLAEVYRVFYFTNFIGYTDRPGKDFPFHKELDRLTDLPELRKATAKAIKQGKLLAEEGWGWRHVKNDYVLVPPSQLGEYSLYNRKDDGYRSEIPPMISFPEMEEGVSMITMVPRDADQEYFLEAKKVLMYLSNDRWALSENNRKIINEYLTVKTV